MLRARVLQAPFAQEMSLGALKDPLPQSYNVEAGATSRAAVAGGEDEERRPMGAKPLTVAEPKGTVLHDRRIADATGLASGRDAHVADRRGTHKGSSPALPRPDPEAQTSLSHISSSAKLRQS